MNFELRNNLSLLSTLLVIILEYYFIDNVRDQYYSVLFTLVFIPVIFHTLSLKRLRFFDNDFLFSILLISSKFLIPLLYIFIFISMYDFSQFYKYSVLPIVLSKPYMYLLALFFSISLISLYLNLKPSFQQFINTMSVFFATLFCCFLAYHLIINDLHRYNENALNLGIVFNPIVQVFNGASVLIDTKSQYGMYPHFFEPLLHLTGISIMSISAFFALFFLITIASWFFFLQQATQNSYLSLIGLIAASFASLSYGSTWPGELYYQYFPIRTLFPAIVLLIFSFYYDHRSWYSRIIISSILSLGIIWNAESGIVAFLGFIILDVYLQYDINKKYKFNMYAIFKNTVFSIFSCAVVVLIFFVYIKIRSGFFPTLAEFFWYQILYGYNAIHGAGIPLSPNMLVHILLYSLGISYGIGSLLTGYRDKLNTGIFLISILGMGTSVYYFLKGQHISHEGYALYPIIILITLFSGRLFLKLRSSNYLNRQWLKNNYQSLFYLFLSVSCISFISSIGLASYKYDVNFSSTARLHEIIFPSATNNKSIGIIKLDNFDSNQYDFDYIKVSDFPMGLRDFDWEEALENFNLPKAEFNSFFGWEGKPGKFRWAEDGANIVFYSYNNSIKTIDMSFTLGTLGDRDMIIKLNNKTLEQFTMKTDEVTKYSYSMQLNPGENILNFETKEPAIVPDGADNRKLLFSIGEFTYEKNEVKSEKNYKDDKLNSNKSELPFNLSDLKLPIWIKKYEVIKKYKNKDGSIRDDIFIFSNYDYFLYLKLNAKAPVKIANINHIWGVADMTNLLKNNKNIRYIIFDNAEIPHPEPLLLYEMFETMKESFLVIESFDIGYTWFNYPNKFSVKTDDFDISHELTNGDPGWHKNIIQVLKRID